MAGPVRVYVVVVGLNVRKGLPTALNTVLAAEYAVADQAAIDAGLYPGIVKLTEFSSVAKLNSYEKKVAAPFTEK